MTALNQTTRRRLQKLPQIPSVWEGDRRPLEVDIRGSEDLSLRGGSGAEEPRGDCILWVDGSQGTVRAMDVVPADAGQEVMVRTLLRGMEQPHSPCMPARPQKIVVSNRELLFYLRGVLQDLDIALDYVPELPLIDELFRSFQEAMGTRSPQLPPAYANSLLEKALELWKVAPWEVLADHEILAVEVNQWDVGTLYASVMGMLGMEYGILLYRSLDSLRRFRERALSDDSMEEMEEAFLAQDCLFVTFEAANPDMASEAYDLGSLPPAKIKPVFGSLHPLEGLRASIYEEEAAALMVAMEALQRFMRQNRSKFGASQFPVLTGRYRIPVPAAAEAPEGKNTLTVTVSSLPDLAVELLQMTNDESSDGPDFPTVRDDLIPANSFLSLGVLPWDMLEMLRMGADYHQPCEVKQVGDGLPVVMIQTSRPKAKTLIQELQDAGGLTAICFNPGEDPYAGDRYDLGLLQTGNGDLHLFGEFGETDPTHRAARKKWEQRCKKTKGVCGLIIAKGLTGANRGKPQFRDMMALFETHALSAKDLGLGTLQLRLAADL